MEILRDLRECLLSMSMAASVQPVLNDAEIGLYAASDV
jgi:hypothetical protein